MQFMSFKRPFPFQDRPRNFIQNYRNSSRSFDPTLKRRGPDQAHEATGIG